MSQRWRFSKMHGAGNDFIVLDGVNQSIVMTPELARRLADRHLGIGADQILLVEPSSQADFKYRIFNADGSEVQHCGNGARCFVRFVHDQGLSTKNPLRAEITTGIIELHAFEHGRVAVDMGTCSFAPESLPFDVQGLRYELQRRIPRWLFADTPNFLMTLSVLSISNPHAVIDVDDVDSYAVEVDGALIGGHPRFPQGVNVGFMQRLSDHEIKLRVYERGAGETLACGTGACAAAVLGIERGILTSPVDVYMRGGRLTVAWDGDVITLTGPTAWVFDGEVMIPTDDVDSPRELR